MTSHELARRLLEGPDVEVLVSSDPEGNEIRALSEASSSMAVVEHIKKFSGAEWTEYQLTHPLDEDEWSPETWAGRVPVVVLWP